MEYQIVARQPLGNVLSYRCDPAAEVKALDDFVFKCCGEHIWDGEYVDEECENIIAKMTEDDVFAFLTQARLCSYTSTYS